MEIWKRIGETNYEASSSGEIKNIKTGRILKQRIDKRTGYYIVDIQINAQSTTFKTHRLIAKTFLIGDPKSHVDHINRDKTNNSVNNLRLVSIEENLKNRRIFTTKKEIEIIINFHKEGKNIDEIYNEINNTLPSSTG